MAPRREPAYLQVARADDDAGEWEDDKEDPGASILEATHACTTPTGAQAWTEAAMPMEMAAQKARHRVSAAYFLAFFGLGMIIASPGPCLLAMVEQTQSKSVAQVSVIFVARAAGYLAGSVLGGVTLDALPTRGNLVLALALLAAAAGTASISGASSLSLLSSLMVMIGLAMGVTDTAANVLMIALHGKGVVDPYMHAQHFFFGLGAFSSPLALLWAMGDTYHYSGAMWAFAAVLATGGAMLLVLPSPNTGGAAAGAAQPNPETQTGGGGAVRCVGMALARREWFVVGATAMFLAQYVGIEVTFGGFIYTYSVQYTGLAQGLSKLVTSCYWGSIAAGRLLSTVLSAYKVSPKAIIEASVTGATLSSLLLCMAPASPAGAYCMNI
mmetsp:Transcript_15148/g.39915  ORF Transcript_15148/g.39915 Transcript_15148/m.39915 type:complete len:384 (-) Transcript_15148:532-1683(-)